MPNAHADARVVVHHGDALEALKLLPDASVHSVVTDPPYGLEFMGKGWDIFAPVQPKKRSGWDSADSGGKIADEGGSFGRVGFHKRRSTWKCSACGRRDAFHTDHGDGGTWEQEWVDPVPTEALAFGEWCRVWAAECLRVLKPGGHLLAFGGSRTWHRLATGIEDAGFELRDSIAWLYGQGFPHGTDVGKAIDKLLGAERPVLGEADYSAPDTKTTRAGFAGIGAPEGYSRLVPKITGAGSPEAAPWSGWNTALKPAFEPVVVARKPLAGTVARNVLAHGTGALNVDGCRIGDEERVNGPSAAPGGNAVRLTGGDGRDTENARAYAAASKLRSPVTVQGRWPANVILDEHTAAELDRQSGHLPGRGNVTPTKRRNSNGVTGWGVGPDGPVQNDKEGGGASRYFYVAKAGKAERPTYRREGHDGTGTQNFGGFKVKACDTCGVRFQTSDAAPPCGHGAWSWVEQLDRKPETVAHPTVKPLTIMRYLLRLVTPPDGIVLEPFAGSGATVEAAMLEGFRVVAIEREADYVPLILQRIARQAAPHAA